MEGEKEKTMTIHDPFGGGDITIEFTPNKYQKKFVEGIRDNHVFPLIDPLPSREVWDEIVEKGS